jgi:hypothetical protein
MEVGMSIKKLDREKLDYQIRNSGKCSKMGKKNLTE